ncbi:AI-2E family transporter [Shinella yambaruensis]|uniref:AI-2E family transporter n=1 Tax=Shinella yambaruensis TaxID=415996 RepID=A0ABQ5Z8J4_9HYPH|nr:MULTISPECIES: AI-2E family transporter [Shinella]CAI0336751.1 putative permease [Rhizobiaceae bacterium]CAK7255282.1 putative permease [Shinella sp. WSC3-e]MCJ8028601.1 AI-2E family transporter [Shinella yambaruensis]MCO5136273.1 AI-2E family transporter [Shinella sp.]MCU7982666.1 AI-2E family transporter [Shinella yambaruensis]
MHDISGKPAERRLLRGSLDIEKDLSEGAPRRYGLDIAAAWAAIGIFAIMAMAVVYLMAPILIPLSLAVVTGLIFGVAAEKLTDLGIPPLPTALLLAGAFGFGVFFIAGLLADPITQLAANAPDLVRGAYDRITPLFSRLGWLNISPQTFESGQMSMEKVLENTGSILGILSASLTPALLQGMIFFAALVLFLSARLKLRQMLIMAFPRRGQRLAAIRVMNAIDSALGYYFATAALVYGALGVVTALITWGGGLAMPVLWGLFAFLSSFVPFLGVTLMTIALATAGLLTHETLVMGLLPALAFFLVHLAMENLVMPAVMGKRLEVNAFIIFTAIIFWTWMWGAAGAMLALPLSIIGMTIADELRPAKRKARRSLPG